jgi:TolB-like protein
LSGDYEQEYFADGIVEDIIAALSRVRSLFVIAHNSSATYKDRLIDLKSIGRELGVRYVLEGSVRKSGARLRITGRLIEAETGVHLWTDHFDGTLEDVFNLQDRVAIGIAGVIEPTLQVTETRRSVHLLTSDLGAYDLYLRALPLLFRLSRSELSAAANMLKQAIASDPNFGSALAFASVCEMRRVIDWVVRQSGV